MSRLAGKRSLVTGGRSVDRLLSVLEVAATFHWRVDFTLVYGQVLEELE